MLPVSSGTSVRAVLRTPTSAHHLHDNIQSLAPTSQQDHYYVNLNNNISPYTTSTGLGSTYDVPKHFSTVIEHCIYRCAYPTTLSQVEYLRDLRPKTFLQLGLDMIPRNIHSAMLLPLAPLSEGLEALHLGIHPEELACATRRDVENEGNDIEANERFLRRRNYDEEKRDFLTMLTHPMYPKVINLSTLLWGSDIFSDTALSSSFSSSYSNILAPLEKYKRLQRNAQRKLCEINVSDGQGMRSDTNITIAGEDRNSRKEGLHKQHMSTQPRHRRVNTTTIGRQSSSSVTGGPKALVLGALEYCLNAENYPIILLCPTGEIETSMVSAGLRILQNWSLAAILSECLLFSSGIYIGSSGNTSGLRKGIWEFIEGELWCCLRRRTVKNTATSNSTKTLTASAPHVDVSYNEYFPRQLEGRRLIEATMMYQQLYPSQRNCVPVSSSNQVSDEGLSPKPDEGSTGAKNTPDDSLDVDNGGACMNVPNNTTTTASESIIPFRYTSAPYWWIECAAMRRATDQETIKRKECVRGEKQHPAQIPVVNEVKQKMLDTPPIEIERVPHSLLKDLTVNGTLSYIEASRFDSGLIPLLGPGTPMPGKVNFPEPYDA